MSSGGQIWQKDVDWSATETKKEVEIFFAEESGNIARLRTVFPEPRNYIRDSRVVLEQSHLEQCERDSEGSCPSFRRGASGPEKGSDEEEAGVHRPHP